MTDQTTPQTQGGAPAAPTATPAPARGQVDYTPAHAAHLIAERQKWVALGNDPAEFDRLCPPPAPFTARGVSNRLDVQDKNRDFASPELADRLAAALLKSGVSQERIDAARAADAGISRDEKSAEMAKALRRQGVAESEIRAAMEKDGTAPPLDTRSPEVQAWDASFGMDREHKPSDYRLVLAPEIKALGLDGMQTFQASATEFLASIGINPGIGAALIEHAVKRGQAYGKATVAEQKLWALEQKHVGLRACGGSQERLDATIALAGQTLKRAINHGTAAAFSFADTLSQSGAAHDWYIVKILAAQAESYNKWQEGRPGKKS